MVQIKYTIADVTAAMWLCSSLKRQTFILVLEGDVIRGAEAALENSLEHEQELVVRDVLVEDGDFANVFPQLHLDDELPAQVHGQEVEGVVFGAHLTPLLAAGYSSRDLSQSILSPCLSVVCDDEVRGRAVTRFDIASSRLGATFDPWERHAFWLLLLATAFVSRGFPERWPPWRGLCLGCGVDSSRGCLRGLGSSSTTPRVNSLNSNSLAVVHARKGCVTLGITSNV